MTLKSRQI